MRKCSSYSSTCVCKVSHLLLCGATLQLPELSLPRCVSLPFPAALKSPGFWEVNSTQPPPSDFRYIFSIFDQFPTFSNNCLAGCFSAAFAGWSRAVPPPPAPWQTAHLASMWQRLLCGIWQKSATLPVAITAIKSTTTHKEMTSRLFLFFPEMWRSHMYKTSLFVFHCSSQWW